MASKEYLKRVSADYLYGTRRKGHWSCEQDTSLRAPRQRDEYVEANEALGFAADERDYSYCKEILSAVNISSVRLMTNNPRKIKGLEDVDIKVTERVSIEIEPNKHNQDYLKVKADKLGHMIGPSD